MVEGICHLTSGLRLLPLEAQGSESGIGVDARRPFSTSALPGIVVHTKACVNALGLERGLSTIRASGIRRIVLFAGDDGEHLTGISKAARLGLTTVAVAIPKTDGLRQGACRHVESWITRVAQARARAAIFLFSDFMDSSTELDDWSRLAAVLSTAGVPVMVENSGQRSDRFSRPSEILRLLRLAPRLGICLDLGHLVCSAASQDELGELWERVRLVDLHDNDGVTDLHQPLGSRAGSGSYREWLPARERGFEYVIETDPRLPSVSDAWIDAIRSDVAELDGALAAGVGL